MTNVQNISQTFNLPKPHQVAEKPGEAQPSFGKFLLEGIQQVNDMQQNADRAVESLFTGGDVNPAEVLSAVQKADMSFKLMMQVRNKMMQAYQEVRDIRI